MHPHVGLGPTGGVPSMRLFLRSPTSPYLHELQRKPLKNLNDYVDKRDQRLNLTPPVYQF